MVQERNFELFIHPVAPVLKETRPTVLAFMEVLKAKVGGHGCLEGGPGIFSSMEAHPSYGTPACHIIFRTGIHYLLM